MIKFPNDSKENIDGAFVKAYRRFDGENMEQNYRMVKFSQIKIIMGRINSCDFQVSPNDFWYVTRLSEQELLDFINKFICEKDKI